MNQETARSSFIAAAIAVVVWVVMGLIFGISRSPLALWALIFAVGTFAITYGISEIVGRRHRP
ncbi:MAG TPA: hypothetical protein VNP95_02315 [Thermomicrobiales bacterium]|nr:hypothetical protein [Thermomicrobiales bacterium]